MYQRKFNESELQLKNKFGKKKLDYLEDYYRYCYVEERKYVHQEKNLQICENAYIYNSIRYNSLEKSRESHCNTNVIKAPTTYLK